MQNICEYNGKKHFIFEIIYDGEKVLHVYHNLFSIEVILTTKFF